MKKLIIAAMLAATPAAALADSELNFVCGAHAVTVHFDTRQKLIGLTVDRLAFTRSPEVIRDVINGQLIIHYYALTEDGSKEIDIGRGEDKTIRAALVRYDTDENGEAVFVSECRAAR